MSTALDHLPGGENQQQNTGTQQNSGTGQEDIQVSQPHVERAEGPFEHSGETSGWTEEERKEKQDQEASQ
jgi:hypothetical protein